MKKELVVLSERVREQSTRLAQAHANESRRAEFDNLSN